METLLESALLGTEKKPLDMAELPTDLQQVLSVSENVEPDMRLLEANSLLWFYHHAGKFPGKFKSKLNEAIIEEQQLVAPEEFLDVYGKLELVDYHIRESLLNLWLNKLIEHQLLVSPEVVIKLLEAGNNLSNTTKGRIVKVIGRKGAWILSHHSGLSYAIPVLKQNIWDEGNSNERKGFFLSMRRNDPEKAISMLKSTWSTESIVNKKAFLEMIKEEPHVSDLSFVEELYHTEFSYQSKEKKSERECRNLLATVLLHFPETGLYKTTTSSLKQYFIIGKKGLLGFVTGKENVHLAFPDQEDVFWNVKTMEQVYGLDTKAYDIARFNSAAQSWCSFFLEVLPSDFWAEPFDGSVQRTLDVFLNDEKLRIKSGAESIHVFLDALVDHIKYYRESAMAALLIERISGPQAVLLLQYLRPVDFETYVSRHKLLGSPEVLASGPFEGDQSWSLNFSEKVVAHALDMAVQNNLPGQLGKVLAQFGHHDILKILLQYNAKAQETTGYYSWSKVIFEPVFTAVEIRNKILAFKK